MDKLLQKLVDSASDANNLAQSMIDSGINSVSEVFKGWKIFGSLTASTEENIEQDETHYILVPLLGTQQEYAIYTKRILPPDVDATNTLPKARIFHVPSDSGKKILEERLITDMVTDQQDSNAGSSDLADALERIADQIDKESNKLSGGMLLIGGAVAMVNPVVGISIAAKSLFPSISTKIGKIGAEFVGNKLRNRNQSQADSKLKKDVSKEVKKLKPTIYNNSIIRSIETIATHPETEFDPAFDHNNWADQFQPAHYYAVTAEAIREIYTDVFSKADLQSYQPSHIQWLRSFTHPES